MYSYNMVKKFESESYLVNEKILADIIKQL